MAERRKNRLVMPVLKWVGGKRQLFDSIESRMPKRITTYCEPFFGGGAVLFARQPKKAIINDLNKDLMIVYRVVKDNVDDLILSLGKHENTAEYYYTMRDRDRNRKAYEAMSDVERASRLIYLNKTCYNGLFRVNSSGEFNTPFGSYGNPNIVNESVLRAVSWYFNSNDISFYSEDFAKVLDILPRSKNTFVYLDPPYDPVSDTANFTGYDKGGFDRNEQRRLKDWCDKLTKRGINWMLSNSATDFILDLYRDYRIEPVYVRRPINSVAAKRGDVEEVLVRNYGTER